MSAKLVIGNKNYSSWSLRAWLMLRESGIEFDEHPILLDVPGTAAAIAGFSAAGRVPILILDGQAIWDTLAIAETLAERYPEKKLWPDDAATRAQARSISAEMHAGFAALRSQMPMNCRAMGRKVPMPDDLKADNDRILEIWSDCGRAHGSGWLFGHFTIADAMFAPVVLRFRSYGVALPDSASAYPDKLMQSAAVHEWLAAAENEIEIIEADEKGQ
jgi:glutathione S-transferase